MKLVNAPIKPDFAYKDHRIVITGVGNGWRAMIYAPRSSSALPESPTNLEESSKEAILTEAKLFVDARCTRADEVIE